jgi:hypothetical protein
MIPEYVSAIVVGLSGIACMSCMSLIFVIFLIYRRYWRRCFPFRVCSYYIPNSERFISEYSLKPESIILSSNGHNYHVKHRGKYTDVYLVNIIKSAKETIHIIPLQRLRYACNNSDHGRTFGCLILNKRIVYTPGNAKPFKLSSDSLQNYTIVGASNVYCIVKVAHYVRRKNENTSGMSAEFIVFFDHYSYRLYHVHTREYKPIDFAAFERIDFVDVDVFILWTGLQVKVCKITNMSIDKIQTTLCTSPIHYDLLMISLANRYLPLEQRLLTRNVCFSNALCRIHIDMSPMFKCIPYANRDLLVLSCNER